jgi:hypothetical protein
VVRRAPWFSVRFKQAHCTISVNAMSEKVQKHSDGINGAIIRANALPQEQQEENYFCLASEPKPPMLFLDVRFFEAFFLLAFFLLAFFFIAMSPPGELVARQR